MFVNKIDHERDLKQAYAEARTVHDYLHRVSGGRPHEVTPLLVLSHAKSSPYVKCRGVFVMSIGCLAEFLASEKQILDGPQRSAIAAALGVKTRTF
jgi:hypothetical protein